MDAFINGTGPSANPQTTPSMPTGILTSLTPTAGNAGTRKIPMTEEVYRCFQAILEDREAPRFEKMIDGYTGFLYLDDQGMPLVAMHWEHRFNHMVNRYNEAFGHRSNAQCVHALWTGGRGSGDGQDGGSRDGQERAGEDFWKEG